MTVELSDDRATRRASARVAVVGLVSHIRTGTELSLPTRATTTTTSPTDSDVFGGLGISDDELRSAANPSGLARLPRMSTTPTPGQVVYSLTGEGVVAGVSYATTGFGKSGVLDGELPWSLAVEVESPVRTRRDHRPLPCVEDHQPRENRGRSACRTV